MSKKKVKLVAWLQNPKIRWDAEDSASCGARGCFSEKGSAKIHQEEILKADYKKRKEKIFEETSGRGHGAVLDESGFVFSIDNLTRASTLFLCTPEYGSHLQQSLRRATAERGFYLPKTLENTSAKKLMQKQFKLYTEMQTGGVPSEDARFILPLFTKTTIQTLWDARELMHLDFMSKREGVPEEIKDTVSQMVYLAKIIAPELMKDRGTNYEPLSWFPSSQLFATSNKTLDNLIDKNSSLALLDYSKIPMSESEIKKAVEERDEAELANLKHYHFTFLAPMSLASFHQATRQRTWNQSIQTLKSAVENGKYILPVTIEKTKFKDEYASLNKEVIGFVYNNFNCPDVVGVLPHALQVYDLIHINGWNAIHSIGKRTCTEAQWEIRHIARQMAKEINNVAPELGKYSVPQGKLYGQCPEKNPCGLCKQ